MVFPVLVSLGFVLDHDNHPNAHFWDYVFVLLAIYAVYQTNKHQKLATVKISFWVVVSLFSTSILLHDWHPAMIYISVAASIVLIGLHVFSWFSGRKCSVLKK
ncbi:hypothetical protein GCM10028791_13360 [Echinicola sediminis]